MQYDSSNKNLKVNCGSNVRDWGVETSADWYIYKLLHNRCGRHRNGLYRHFWGKHYDFPLLSLLNALSRTYSSLLQWNIASWLQLLLLFDDTLWKSSILLELFRFVSCFCHTKVLSTLSFLHFLSALWIKKKWSQ